MTVKIKKWGNSLGVRIPKSIAEKTNIHEDSEVEIEAEGDQILIFPAQKRFNLQDLVERISSKNLHSLEEDQPTGNEAW